MRRIGGANPVPDVSDVPEAVRRLAAERDAMRRAKDYAGADTVRERIRVAGFEITDTADGPVLSPVRAEPSPPRRLAASEVVGLLDRPASADATVTWIVEGWPEDVRRGIAAFDRNHPARAIQHVVADLTGTSVDGWRGVTDLVLLRDDVGWAAARNAGLMRALGRVVIVADGSIETTGDVVSPLIATLEDPSIGVTGPFGIVTDDLREFHGSAGPDVDAIEGYLMAFRREAVVDGLRFDERFRFYRTADIELSFRIKATGLRATVTPLPLVRHEHRMWEQTPTDRRDALSKRNYYRFLDRWRGRFDLTVAHATTEGR